MAADLRRVILAAAQAALDEAKAAPAVPTKSGRNKKKKRKKLPAGRALLIGAGLVTAGRATLGGRGRDLMAGVQDRIYEFEESLLGEDGLLGDHGVNGHNGTAEPDEVDDDEVEDEDEDSDEEPEDSELEGAEDEVEVED